MHCLPVAPVYPVHPRGPGNPGGPGGNWATAYGCILGYPPGGRTGPNTGPPGKPGIPEYPVVKRGYSLGYGLRWYGSLVVSKHEMHGIGRIGGKHRVGSRSHPDPVAGIRKNPVEPVDEDPGVEPVAPVAPVAPVDPVSPVIPR